MKSVAAAEGAVATSSSSDGDVLITRSGYQRSRERVGANGPNIIRFVALIDHSLLNVMLLVFVATNKNSMASNNGWLISVTKGRW